MKSIEGRLLRSILLSAAILLLAAGLVLEARLRAEVEHEFDRNLLAKAMTLVTLTDQESGNIEFDSDKFMPQFSAPENPEYFEIWQDGGERIERSPSLGDERLPRTEPTFGVPRFNDIPLPDGRDGRMVELKFIPFVDEHDSAEATDSSETRELARNSTRNPTQLRAVLALAVSRENLDGLILAVRLTLLATMLSVLVATAVSVRFAVGRGLQPLRELAGWVKHMDVDKLDTRFDLAEKRVELVPIAAQLNSLLQRLEDAFQREKRFSGDVAHELRTPLAELRALADVGHKWPDDRDLVAGFFGDVAVITANMERIVTNLLALTRYDAGKLVLEQTVVELDSVVRRAWLKVEPDARANDIVLEHEPAGGVLVRTDPTMLELVVVNLIANAVQYSPSGSAVSVSAQRNGSAVTLAISNTSSDLNAEDLPSMFDRFWRKESSRTGGQHAGLGLALVKSVADALNLGITPKFDDDARFCIVVTDLQLA